MFSTGQLIWGKLKGFDWWPGMVVDFKSTPQSLLDSRPNEVWIKWYGDNKFSKVREGYDFPSLLSVHICSRDTVVGLSVR